MRMKDVMQALADGDAQVVDVTSFAALDDPSDTVGPISDYERQVELG
jgi:hypothetical protein